MTSTTEDGLRTATSERAHDDYVLGRSPAEYERLRAQARVWEAETGRLLDRSGLAAGARCLDAGCGPGETMRLMAQRVGPTGHVLGVDVDAALGHQALDMLHGAGHPQCAFAVADLEAGEPIPGAPFDLVYARLLLFHVSDPVAVLRRLWDAVTPGGVLAVHDYDLLPIDVVPELDAVREWKRVVFGAFTGAGRDIAIGHRLPLVFAQAGLGAPDDTSVAGQLEPLRVTAPMLSAVYRSLLPAATGLGLISAANGERWLDDFARESHEHGDYAVLWPLLIGAWKTKPGA